MQTECVIAGRGYDSERVLENIEKRGALAVIPPKSNRKEQREYDKELYKQRNLIERTINKLKRFRRTATRYERNALYFRTFLGDLRRPDSGLFSIFQTVSPRTRVNKGKKGVRA